MISGEMGKYRAAKGAYDKELMTAARPQLTSGMTKFRKEGPQF